MSTFSSPSAVMSVKSIDPNDCNVPNAGTDGVSSLCWSPTANILVSSNWDSTVSCWEVQEQGGRIQANPKAQSKNITTRCCFFDLLMLFNFWMQCLQLRIFLFCTICSFA